jgi:hypothetical protein
MAPDTSQSLVWIDGQHRTQVDGKPFFPLGVYMRTSPWTFEQNLMVLKDSPFNCVMSYDALSTDQMDEMNQTDIKVIYSVKDYYNRIWYCPTSIKSVEDELPVLNQKVQQFRNHPALLAWYINDELGPDSLSQIRAHHELIAREDPNHPTWNLYNDPEEMNVLMNAADIMGIDSYPIPPKAPLSNVAKDTLETVQGARQHRPVWVVPTISNPTLWGEEDGRPPTLEEMRCSSWLAICSGDRGLIYYGLHMVQADTDPNYTFDERWPEIKQMAEEISNKKSILLGDTVDLAIEVEALDWLHWTARRIGDKLYIIAVSDGDGEGLVHFQIPVDVEEVTREVIGTEADDWTTLNPEWTDVFEKNEVKIYTVQLANTGVYEVPLRATLILLK